MTKAKTLTEQYAQLDTAVEEAEDALSAARQRQRTGRLDTAREVLSPLADLHSAIRFNRPDAPPPEERDEAKLSATRDLFAAIEERGLTLVPIEAPEGPGLVVVDPSIDADYDAALAAKGEAVRKLVKFNRENTEGLSAERKAARAAAYRKAIDDGDLDLADRLLRQGDDEDERTARERTADALVSGEYTDWDADGSEIRRTDPAPDGALTTAG